MQGTNLAESPKIPYKTACETLEFPACHLNEGSWNRVCGLSWIYWKYNSRSSRVVSAETTMLWSSSSACWLSDGRRIGVRAGPLYILIEQVIFLWEHCWQETPDSGGLSHFRFPFLHWRHAVPSFITSCYTRCFVSMPEQKKMYSFLAHWRMDDPVSWNTMVWFEYEE